MKMDRVAGSKNDEFYTPYYAVEPLIKYLKPDTTVWCPFDTEDSLFVKVLKREGHQVLNSHINEGKDFFEYIPLVEYDYIISNPPYSLKTEVLEKLFKMDKPFAMLVGVAGLFESQKHFLKIQFLEGARRYDELYKHNELKYVFVYSKRISTVKNGEFDKYKSTAFCHAWFVWEKGYTGKPTIDWIY